MDAFRADYLVFEILLEVFISLDRKKVILKFKLKIKVGWAPLIPSLGRDRQADL